MDLEQTHDFPADTLSGGRGFTRAGAEILADYPSMEQGMNNWIYLYKVLIDARERDLSIGGIKVDLVHPNSMVEQEQDSSDFDRKRYEQFRLQLDYLLNNTSTKDSAEPIVRAVLAALEGLDNGFTNEEFSHQLDRLEQRLSSLGYIASQ